VYGIKSTVQAMKNVYGLGFFGGSNHVSAIGPSGAVIKVCPVSKWCCGSYMDVSLTNEDTVSARV
jgi:hypothetical protein